MSGHLAGRSSNWGIFVRTLQQFDGGVASSIPIGNLTVRRLRYALNAAAKQLDLTLPQPVTPKNAREVVVELV